MSEIVVYPEQISFDVRQQRTAKRIRITIKNLGNMSAKVTIKPPESDSFTLTDAKGKNTDKGAFAAIAGEKLILDKNGKTKAEFWGYAAGFPENLEKYSLIIHCGACMLNEKEVLSRMREAERRNVAFTNYGTVIAFMNGILSRSLEIMGKVYTDV